MLAAADGVVSSVGTNRLGGNVVWLFDLARRHTHYYAHLSRQAVRTGETVRAGDVIGYVGNTGNARSTPPHLHFGIYTLGSGPIDPLPFVEGASASNSQSPTPGSRTPRGFRPGADANQRGSGSRESGVASPE